jgi:hypothetical protein
MLIRVHSEKEAVFWQRLILSEEERRSFTTWRGGYRWFRSPNVTPIEWYRRIEPIPNSRKVA